MREMKESGIVWMGSIPRDYYFARLKDYFEFEKGKNAAIYTQEYIGENKGDYPVYSGQTENNGIMGTINSFDYDIDECLFTTTVGAKVMTLKILNGKFSLSQNCLIMKSKNNCLNKFFYYLLMTLFNYEKSMISAYMQPSLRIEDLKKYRFFIPNISEQEKIVKLLDNKITEIDNVIEKTKETIEDYKKYKQSIITKATTKGINPNVIFKDSNVEWIGLIPNTFKVIKIRYIGNLQNGISAGGEKFGDGFPFANYGDIYNNYELPEELTGLINSTEKERKLYSIKRGDIFFTRTSETIEEIGFSSVATKDYNNACFSGFIIRLRPSNQSLLPEFYKYYFRSDIHRKYFNKEMNIVTRASLGQDLLKSMPIVVPTIEEQQQIATYLDNKCAEIDSLIENKQKIIDELEKYKKSLIYEYVTGKKEVV